MCKQGVAAVSDYLAIGDKIADFKENHPANYKECVNELLDILADYFPALQHNSSPILANMPFWEAEDLAFLIVEYSGWTNETIHMFLDSRIRMHWERVRNEIERNVGEEMGALTCGIPHLEMMRQGHRRDLAIETDNVDHSGVTKYFVRRMRNIFKHEDNAYGCGALLAFEATATDEFKIVDRFLRKRKNLIGGELEKGSLTDLYIAGHVDHEGQSDHPEDSHYAGLEEAIGFYITPRNIHRFIQGFLDVCMNMNMWWEQLTAEIYYRKLKRTQLAVQDSEVIDISEVFKRKSA